jgi:hypothetical protein
VDRETSRRDYQVEGINEPWYETNRAEAGGNYGSKTYEIVNFMDGKRTLLDIRHIVSCEYDETGVEFVLHFAKDLEKIGLISFE